MANLTRTFTGGRMNKTYDERIVPDGEYIDALNIRMGSTENSEIGVIENTKGNTVLTDLLYPVTGQYLSVDALCIGAFSDTANDTLYWFVHDQNFPGVATSKLDLIVSFNILTNVLIYHVVSADDGNGSNTTLNFNPSYLISSVNLIDNLLFFTDNYNPPRFIDVTKNYLLPDGANIDYNGSPELLREALLVIKKPPITSPTVQLITQGNQNNYLEERFISFAYRYKYANGEYSATSQWSDIAFLPKPFEFSVNSYLNEGMTNEYNAAIISYETGGPLVVGIDLLFKQANNNIIKVIEKLDKALLGIPNDVTQSFTFSNSKIFTILTDGEILRLYDNVPRLAKAQTIMGNRLMYGNYIEGYDLIDTFGSPTRLEYETELITEQIGYESLTTETWIGEQYTINGSFTGISNSALRINLAGITLVAGSSITIDLTFEGIGSWGSIPFSPDQPPTSITFSFTLPVSYGSVYDMVSSTEFQNAIGTTFNILPVYSPIPFDPTSCNGTTFTDAFNCSILDTVTNTTTFVAYEKYESGINGPNEPIPILEVSPGNDFFSIQLLAMAYVDDPAVITDTVYGFYRIIEHEAYFQKVGAPRSLHSNRDYEIGMVYMDEFNRATTALVSPFNTEHVPCRLSVNKNSIKVTIPISQRAPAWAKRFKFVCKADAENYETIYTSLFFTQVGTNNIYFLLQGENMRKVEVGDRYIVKRDTSGALLNCAYATVLEKEAQQAGFISTTSGAAPPAGVYMKMAPEGFQAELPANAVINPGSITTNENNGGDYPLQDYPMNIWDGAAWVDYTVPAGSIIQMSFNFTRRGAGDGNNSCERRIYDNSVTLVSTANYDNMYDWWVGDNVESVLNSGTQEVGGSGNCPILNTFYPTLGIPAGDVCNNKYQFYRYGDNRLVLKITGTQRCNGSTGSERRRSSITTKITVFRTDALVVFETFPNDTLPDVFFENNLSFPIDKEGNHLSDGALGDVSQDIGSGIPGEFNTGFFNCFAFGNGIESYKVRDSLIGRAFNLGERVTTVSAQDYQEARRFADITYSGVYNQETNVNKLNEFNLGLLNFKNLEASFGDIQILDGRETDVLTLQEDKISYVLAGKNLLSDAGAGSALTSVPEVLGNQIARVEKYGISFNPESYVQWGYDRFFTDVKRGAVIQLKGDSMSQDQLAVISEANMRTWFRDEFINSFTTQKLGGYDPYMNEYVLSTNDRQLPAINLCSECGITQVFSASAPIEENVLAAQYCVELGSAVGEVSVQWEVISISEGALFDVQANYDGSTSSSGYINYGDGFSFPKSLITLTTAEIYLYVTNGEVVLSLTVYCPESRPITVIEVVLTSDQNSGETIHTQYRYVDGAYFSPLQTNSVLFDIGTNPVVSRYNATTGTQGTGAIPTDGSTLIIGTNKIVPDTYDFNTVGNSFKWLRSSTFYSATPGDIADLLSASITATPITGGPIQYQSSFVVPSTGEGYLYLIWDLRNSSVSYLCAAKDEEGIYDICCDCGPCTANCVQMSFVNKSEEDEATIYFPSGLCGQGTPITITLEPYESTEKICFVNADFYITSGDVRIEDYSCDCSCTPVCSEYVVWSNVGFCEVEFTNCSDELSTIALGTDEIAKICVLPGTLPSLIVGVANVFLVNECFCGECLNPVECWTWTAENVGRGIANFLIKDCAGNEIELSVLPSQTLTFCAFPYANPVITSGDIDFNIINTCNCTI